MEKKRLKSGQEYSTALNLGRSDSLVGRVSTEESIIEMGRFWSSMKKQQEKSKPRPNSLV